MGVRRAGIGGRRSRTGLVAVAGVVLGLVTALPGSPAAAAPVELITNGGFEDPEVPGLGFFSEIPGWTDQTGCFIEVQAGGAGSPYEGSQLVELDANCSATIRQEVPVQPGRQYLLSYAFSGRPGFGSSDNVIEVRADDDLVDTATADDPGGDTAWELRQVELTATRDVLTLDFADAGVSDSLGTYLDAVSLVEIVDQATPIPPNSTWPDAAVLTPGVPVEGTLDMPGEARWYRFPVQPDSTRATGPDRLRHRPRPGGLLRHRRGVRPADRAADLSLLSAEFAATPSARPSTPRPSTPRRSTARRSTPRRSTARRSTPRRSTARRSTPRRSTPRRSTPRRSTPRRSTARTPSHPGRSTRPPRWATRCCRARSARARTPSRPRRTRARRPAACCRCRPRPACCPSRCGSRPGAPPARSTPGSPAATVPTRKAPSPSPSTSPAARARPPSTPSRRRRPSRTRRVSSARSC